MNAIQLLPDIMIPLRSEGFEDIFPGETPPSKLGGIFQMYYLITFAHSSPQQADGVSCAAFMNLPKIYLGENLGFTSRETTESSVPWEFPGTTTQGITDHLEL